MSERDRERDEFDRTQAAILRHDQLRAALAAAEARAEVAERKVAAVKVLADQWEFGVPDAYIGRGAVVEGLRAALDTPDDHDVCPCSTPGWTHSSGSHQHVDHAGDRHV